MAKISRKERNRKESELDRRSAILIPPEAKQEKRFELVLRALSVRLFLLRTGITTPLHGSVQKPYGKGVYIPYLKSVNCAGYGRKVFTKNGGAESAPPGKMSRQIQRLAGRRAGHD